MSEPSPNTIANQRESSPPEVPPTDSVSTTAGESGFDPITEVESNFDRVRPRNTRKSSRITFWVIAGLLAVLLIVCVVMGRSFLRWQSMTSDEVANRFGSHPLIVEQMGGLDSCRFSLIATATHDTPETSVLAFRVSGEKAIGFLYIKSVEGSVQDAEWAGLRINDQFWKLENDRVPNP